MKDSVRNSVLEAVAKTIKGTTFVSIKDYETQKGEVANYLIIAGYSTENAMQHDFKALQENKEKVFYDLSKDFEFDVVKQAYAELYESLEKRLSSDEVKEKLRQQGDTTILRSDAQNDAFEYIAPGVKRLIENQEIHIIGLQVKKKVIIPIEYKATKSKPVVECKNKIQKLCEFRQAKIRSFKFDKAIVNLQGIQIK